MVTNQRIKVELGSGRCVSLNMQGEYFFGESQRRLSGKWQLNVIDNKIFLEDEIEIIIASERVLLMPIKEDDNKCAVELNELSLDEYNGDELCSLMNFGGNIIIEKQEQYLVVLNLVDVESFVTKVLSNCCPKAAQLEYLKVQALVIRNAAILLVMKKNDNGQTFDSLQSSNYNSVLRSAADNLSDLYVATQQEPNDLVRKAVEATYGMALVYNDKIRYIQQKMRNGEEREQNAVECVTELYSDTELIGKDGIMKQEIPQKYTVAFGDGESGEVFELSRSGALELATQGKTMEQIIEHYLPGFEIQKQY